MRKTAFIGFLGLLSCGDGSDESSLISSQSYAMEESSPEPAGDAGSGDADPVDDDNVAEEESAKTVSTDESSSEEAESSASTDSEPCDTSDDDDSEAKSDDDEKREAVDAQVVPHDELVAILDEFEHLVPKKVPFETPEDGTFELFSSYDREFFVKLNSTLCEKKYTCLAIDLPKLKVEQTRLLIRLTGYASVSVKRNIDIPIFTSIKRLNLIIKDRIATRTVLLIVRRVPKLSELEIGGEVWSDIKLAPAITRLPLTSLCFRKGVTSVFMKHLITFNEPKRRQGEGKLALQTLELHGVSSNNDRLIQLLMHSHTVSSLTQLTLDMTPTDNGVTNGLSRAALDSVQTSKLKKLESITISLDTINQLDPSDIHEIRGLPHLRTLIIATRVQKFPSGRDVICLCPYRYILRETLGAWDHLDIFLKDRKGTSEQVELCTDGSVGTVRRWGCDCYLDADP